MHAKRVFLEMGCFSKERLFPHRWYSRQSCAYMQRGYLAHTLKEGIWGLRTGGVSVKAGASICAEGGTSYIDAARICTEGVPRTHRRKRGCLFLIYAPELRAEREFLAYIRAKRVFLKRLTAQEKAKGPRAGPHCCKVRTRHRSTRS
jgi:hypothetical protein